MIVRGFLLQASYRTITQSDGRRVPVVHLYGAIEGGGSFQVRDDRPRPGFYIRSADASAALAMRAPSHCTHLRNFSGESVSRLECPLPADVPDSRDRLHAAGIETYEADVRFAVRYLIERGIKGGCEIEGDAVSGKGVTWVFDNPTLRPAAVAVQPRVLSFDIETDGKADRLLAISLFGLGLDEVLIVDGSERKMPMHATACVNEYAALQAFCDRVLQIDPDVLTGWNIIDFDLSVLQRIALRVRHPFSLGRNAGAIRIRKAEGFFGSGQAVIPGRLVLDGIDLLRGAFVRMEDYSLDAVAREVLGEGKALSGAVQNRVEEIVHNYRHDLDAFALYARTDSRLALQILDRMQLVPLAFARSELAGMTPDRVSASIASFDFLYLSELAKRGIVAPTVRAQESLQAAQQGGHVLESAGGLHSNVWVFDYTSLYPSIIRTFNIDPVSYVPDADVTADLIRTPGGSFVRTPAILPQILDELFPRREAAKRAGDAVASNAIKILMNSFYGVLGTPACRFYNPALANSITGTGKELLLWSKSWFEAAGYDVLYGDTDSLFVDSHMTESAAAVELGHSLAAKLSGELAHYIAERWQVPSRLSLKFEKLYAKLFLPLARHSTRGASKRYAGLRFGAQTAAGDDALEFTGMEAVRRDWTALAKQVQRELYQRLFRGERVDVYLADMVRRVRNGEFDAHLVYRKNLRKGAAGYTAITPPHVVAARKSSRPPGRSISYVITTAGPEPFDEVRHPLDREHYVMKQVQPVSVPVLAALGLDFEQVIGDGRQIDLFGSLL